MTLTFANEVNADFNDTMITDLGEYVSYYAYGPTYEATYGYMLTHTEPTASRVKIIIATFTQKDKQEFDVGNISVDDHKAYIPSTITPVAGDEILRGDTERYKVVSIMHQHKVAGTTAYTTVVIRRRP